MSNKIKSRSSKTHKHQHYVPKSYLSAWCDPNSELIPNTNKPMEPYVWAFPRDGGDAKRRAPQNLFTENDIYTNVINIPGYGEYRDLRIERGLKEIEENFYRLRDDFVQKRKSIPMVPRIKLLVFVAAQQSRTPRMRDHQREQWKKFLDTTDDVYAAGAQIAKEDRVGMRWDVDVGDGKTISRENLVDVVERPLQNLLVPAIEGITKALSSFHMCILCATGSEKFITSDDPVVWFDPEAYKRPEWLRSPATMYPKTEVTMAIDTRHSLLLSHRQFHNPYIEIEDRHVTELNRRTRAYATEFFVACGPDARPEWYDYGSPPKV